MAVIIDEDGRVLLTRRSIPPFQDLWVMPGGKIELGETIISALKREVHEEVGLEIEIQELIDVFEHLTPGEGNCHFVILYYRCRPVYCDLLPNEYEVSEAAWVPASDLNNYITPAGARYILGRVFPELAVCKSPVAADA